MDEKGLGRRLQAARQAAHMTQQALCQKAGLSYSTLAKIERGAIKSPSIFTIQNIATALDVGLDSLLGTVAPKPAVQVPQKLVAESGVRFVYFDINGCLVHFFQSAFTKLAQDSGSTPDAVETGFWHFNDQVCRGEMSVEAFNQAYAKRLGLKTLDWQSYYLDAVEPIAAMRELVAWTAKRYHVGLLSNIMPGFIAALQADNLLPDVAFDAIIDSSEVGSVKPEKRIYEVAIQRAGVKPEEILFIDDSRPNLMAAERFGWRVLWFDGYRAEDSTKRIRAALVPRDAK